MIKPIFLDNEFRLTYKNRNKKSNKDKISVTVCIAAMCDGNTIIGASDRMLTAGDIEFEPQQTKTISITSSIVCMIAGDSAMQMEIIQYVKPDVNKRIESNPDEWWKVRDVAELYSLYYKQACLRRAENQILAPLGLDHESFLRRQQEMDPTLVLKLSTELINFDPPDTAAIFAGIDTGGPQIYVVNNADVNCQNLVGFAAIGVGVWHANSQLMFAGHTKYRTFPETLLSVYSAKKRAEVAPGVGEATDMFCVGPTLGSYFSLGDHVLSKLKQIYNEEQKREKRAATKARVSVSKYVDEIAQEAKAKDQEMLPTDSGRDTSVDKKGFPAIPEETGEKEN